MLLLPSPLPLLQNVTHYSPPQNNSSSPNASTPLRSIPLRQLPFLCVSPGFCPRFATCTPLFVGHSQHCKYAHASQQAAVQRSHGRGCSATRAQCCKWQSWPVRLALPGRVRSRPLAWCGCRAQINTAGPGWRRPEGLQGQANVGQFVGTHAGEAGFPQHNQAGSCFHLKGLLTSRLLRHHMLALSPPVAAVLHEAAHQTAVLLRVLAAAGRKRVQDNKGRCWPRRLRCSSAPATHA